MTPAHPRDPGPFTVAFALAMLPLSLWALPFAESMVPRRTIFAVLVLAAFALALRRRALLAAPAFRNAIVVAALITIAATTIPFWTLKNGGAPAYEAAGALLPVMVGWIVLLLLLPSSSSPDGSTQGTDWADWRAAPWMIPALIGLTAVALTLIRMAAVGDHTMIGDESLYLVQSRWLEHPGFGWSVPPEIEEAFRWRRLSYEHGRLVGMYTPGWPAILALFDAFGLRWWSGVILGALSVLLTYYLGRRLHSPAAGAVAAVLLAVQPWAHYAFAGYMSHAASVPLALGAALCLLTVEREPSARRALLAAMAAGLLLAVMVTVRVLTGLTIGVSLVLWIAVRGRVRPARGLVLLFALVLGAAPIAAALLFYNNQVFGDPFTVGYRRIAGTLYSLGFGPRGVLGLDAELRPAPRPFDYSAQMAFGKTLAHLAAANLAMLGAGLLLPVIAAVSGFLKALPWRFAAPFAVLPIVHVLYWGTSPRFYTELLPFLYVAIGWAMVMVARRHARFAASLVGAAIAGSLAFATPWHAGHKPIPMPWRDMQYFSSPGRTATFRSVDSLASRQGPLLIFVREVYPWFDSFTDYMYLYNAEGFDGPVLVARDRGPASNNQLARRFPNRRPYLATDGGRNLVARLEPFEPTPRVGDNGP